MSGFSFTPNNFLSLKKKNTTFDKSYGLFKRSFNYFWDTDIINSESRELLVDYNIGTNNG